MNANPRSSALRTLTLSVLAVLSAAPVHAGIVSVVEDGIGADAPAIWEPNGPGAVGSEFDEEALTFSDRTHQHNGAAFDEFTGELSTTGTLVVPLPAYLVGNEYVRFANNARDNNPYLATITTDQPSRFYLLIDNRLNGPAGTGNSPNTTDPELGGTLQWVIDGGWQRVNTGISPGGKPDYTGVDEGGDQIGPGLGLNQFYSVWTLPVPATLCTVRSNGFGGNNMISLVVVPDDGGGPTDPIGSFAAAPSTIAPGGSATLSWFIDPAATAATIEPGIGDILGETGETGAGSLVVSPSTETTYTLSVTTPTGAETREVTVGVSLLASFTVDRTFVPDGESATLSWQARTDATLEILPDIGPVNDLTGIDGKGSIQIEAVGTKSYTLRATAGDETAEAEVLVFGGIYVAIDIGGDDGQPEPGAAEGVVIGAGPNNTNATDLLPVELTTLTGDTISIEIDSFDPDGFPIGGLDWRNRGNAPAVPLARLAQDLVKNNLGMVHVTLDGLPPGEYEVTSFHIDPTFSQGEEIVIKVTDALGTARDTGARGDASWEGHPDNGGAPPVAGLTPELVLMKATTFEISSNGDPVSIYFDGSQAPVDDETPLAGLILRRLSLGQLFQIQSIVIEDGEVTITWPSRPGQLFIIRASTDLVLWEERDDSYPPGGASGESTSYTEPVQEGVPNLYYQVLIQD